MRGNSPNKSVRRSDFSKASPGDAMSTVQRVRKLMASMGLNGAPLTSGKNGNILFFATGMSKWMRVPSLKAFMTWLANRVGDLNQRMARASPCRGSTPRYTGSEGSNPKCGRPALGRHQEHPHARHDVKHRVVLRDSEVVHHAVVRRFEPRFLQQLSRRAQFHVVTVPGQQPLRRIAEGAHI